MIESGKMNFSISEDFASIYDAQDGYPTFRFFIGGEWKSSNEKDKLISPLDQNLIGAVYRTPTDQVDLAIKLAKESQQKIRSLAGIERIGLMNEARNILMDHREDFIKALMLEGGKTREGASGEIESLYLRMGLTMEDARKIFGEYLPGDWSKDTASKIALVIREPVGVVAAIGPFNYPLFIPAAKIIPALLAGNSVVVKPTKETPVSTIMFVEILNMAGFPKGTISVITGPGSVIGNAIASHKDISMLSFTGSTETGRNIASVAGIKKLHMELGGKAYAIVLKDADLGLAAKKIVSGSLSNAGQRCDAISAVLAVQDISEKLVELVVNEAKAFKLGNPMLDPQAKVGPVINRAAALRIKSLIDDAVSNGARALLGGGVHDTYVEPTVLYDVPDNAKILWEEIFGPVIPIHKVKDADEAISLARRSEFGLDSCIFTNNFYDMWKVAKSLQVGEVSINDMPKHGLGYFPFGGTKNSGTGREGVGFSIDEMTNIKTIVFNLEPGSMGKKIIG
ncbi:MAG: aldehyde dehydrogenase family protein [Nitrososphaerota archaeon]|nr:aldehyde dehydrogenase family protein [Nitrososphaerota archaeon]MDG6930914.1 aldehyde dehydrogenase family protein [Nitrososphaerota archaeon]